MHLSKSVSHTASPNAGGISGIRTERWRRSDLPEGEILPLMPCLPMTHSEEDWARMPLASPAGCGTATCPCTSGRIFHSKMQFGVELALLRTPPPLLGGREEQVASYRDEKRDDALTRPCVCLMSRTSWFSITTDNGTEFTHFKFIERVLKIPVFFAKPYCSADKPHIENINGLIRQYIPKGKSFDEISDDEIRQIQNQLNNRPRKKLGYKTPYEVFFLHL